MWHRGLIAKLRSIGVEGNLLNWFISYLQVGGGGGGGGKRRGLGPRNDVLSTCKAVTLRGGQRVIDVFPTLNILIS